MVDIHSHILPMIDDGSGSFEETIEMLSIAEKYDVRHIVASCHGNLDSYSYNIDQYREAFERLKSRIRQRNIHVKIYPGMEIMLSEDEEKKNQTPAVVDRLKANELLTINNTDYVLVEVPFNVNTRYIIEQTQKLMQAGYRVILAHPERYQVIQNHPERTHELVEAGCILQINTGSVAGVFGKGCQQVTLQLLDMEVVQIIATDAHDTNRRSHRMRDVIDVLFDRYGEDVIHLLTSENPSRVLKGMELLTVKDIM